MSENTLIEWADHTFNPWIGCTKVSPGCDHCYAEAWQARFAGRDGVTRWGTGAERGRTTPANWRKPLQWNARAAEFAAQHGRRQRVFCASLADVFDNAVPPSWRADLFSLIKQTPDLDWLLLTKRIGNVRQMMVDVAASLSWLHKPVSCHIPANVWLGATVVNQAEADRDVPKLLGTPAAVRFLSIEPMLGPIDLADAGAVWTDMNGQIGDAYGLYGVDWIICGGESGPKARPMHPDWARGLRDQCLQSGTPFLFKQWGEFLPASADGDDPCVADVDESRLYWSDGQKWDRHDGQRGGVDLVARVGKKAAGRGLDGMTHDGFPGASS